MIAINITQQDIDAAWKPKTESARLYHSPLNLAIARAFKLPFRSAYSKCGWGYFAISNDGEYQMYDIVEVHTAYKWGEDWNAGRLVYPITLSAVPVSSKKKPLSV